MSANVAQAVVRRYEWVRCPTCQTKTHRRVKVPGLTWARCKVCRRDMTIRCTVAGNAVVVVVSPAKGV